MVEERFRSRAGVVALDAYWAMKTPTGDAAKERLCCHSLNADFDPRNTLDCWRLL